MPWVSSILDFLGIMIVISFASSPFFEISPLSPSQFSFQTQNSNLYSNQYSYFYLLQLIPLAHQYPVTVIWFDFLNLHILLTSKMTKNCMYFQIFLLQKNLNNIFLYHFFITSDCKGTIKLGMLIEGWVKPKNRSSWLRRLFTISYILSG